MSFSAGFRFKDFTCDASIYDSDRQIQGVSFSVYSGTDLEKCAVVTVNIPHNACEPTRPWEPDTRKTERYRRLKGDGPYVTLFDARMGNVDCGKFMKTHCTTCRSIELNRESLDASVSLAHISKSTDEGEEENPRCTGHYGKIDLPIPLVHPLLQNEALSILNSMCWKCKTFRILPAVKEKINDALISLMKSDYISADKSLDIAMEMASSNIQRDVSHSETFSRFDSEFGDLSNKLHSATTNMDHKMESEFDQFRVDNTQIRLRKRIMKDFFSLCQSKCPNCSYNSPVNVILNRGILYFEPPLMDVPFMEILKSQSRYDITAQKASYWCLNPWLLRFLIGNLKREEGSLLSLLYNRLFGCPKISKEIETTFQIQSILVPPNASRSWKKLGNEKFAVVDQATEELSSILLLIDDYHSTIERLGVEAYASGYMQLQSAVNKHFTNTIASFLKKSGIFRNNMMGKRANQACRSVISPDSYLPTNGLCIPTKFASRLTFPESLAFNSEERKAFLIQCIRNGTTVYPGATHIEIMQREGSTQTLSLKGKEKTLNRIADKMLKDVILGYNVIVHRHVVTGDMVILNRQPTLHKSSMLGTRAVVTGNAHTLRFHYVNCKGFNADFDGDEMNCHVPQGEKCRAELKCLMDGDSHYFSVSSGKPIRGLIQDHLIAAFRLTLRSEFLSQDELIAYSYHFSDSSMVMPQPCILKPRTMWTGKQLISEALKKVCGVYSSDNAGLTIRARCTTEARYICHDLEDGENETLQVHKSEIMTGVLDAANLGLANKSLVHFLVDIYGSKTGAIFLGGIGRLLSSFMKKKCLSIKISDLCVAEDLKKRSRLWKLLDDLDYRANSASESSALRMVAELNTKINKEFYPDKTLSRFPRNNLILMTAIGARGSNSNAYQMMIALGQQFFDNRRIGSMPSGKVLPGTLPHDRRAKCHGFVKGRFISGIRPQEYFIHAAAGRDGIIDTAIKTARSGYLQRCLIKGMESSVVQWDGSVHNGEGEIVQFRYGGDGKDASKNMITGATHLEKHENDFAYHFDEDLSEKLVDSNELHQKAYRLEQRRSMLSRCEPGEPVGLLAAQSLGEPSTQMTLNTFHHTGSTSSHVSEGIPRVRELLCETRKGGLVTVPIKHVGVAEVETCSRIKNIILSVNLQSFLSSAARSPLHLTNQHSKSGMHVNISLLFSASALERRQKLMFQGDMSFRNDFVQSIVNLFKSFVSKAFVGYQSGDKKPMYVSEFNAAFDGSMDDAPLQSYDDSGAEDDDTHDTAKYTTAVTEVETDVMQEEILDLKEKTIGEIPKEVQIERKDSLTSWERPSIRISKSDRRGFSVTLDGIKAHSYVAEYDCFEVSCQVRIMSSGGACNLKDMLEECLHQTSLPNKDTSFSGEFSLCELYRDEVTQKSTLAFKGSAASIGNVKQLLPYITPIESFDWNAMASSNPQDLHQNYGIEAGRTLLESELNRLFEGYSVNFRHNMLVADSVSHSGALLPYTRYGLVKAAAASPFLQMTFETGGKFLDECLRHSNYDALRSFSSSLIVGNKPTVGSNFGKLMVEA
ncbi:DNA-directed RNA polymerase I largest subunit [Perkinsela sp. CCAP 1560/4]|nr:DNA-directed RNA polymerase I largest subunit [Perkinsela sp. CCAP 1560/4]|eukprot:KNH07861.1 DNA-directed RNA polymerase I largest subunit [Perkinsela sp. CCAP 1560/4]